MSLNYPGFSPKMTTPLTASHDAINRNTDNEHASAAHIRCNMAKNTKFNGSLIYPVYATVDLLTQLETDEHNSTKCTRAASQALAEIKSPRLTNAKEVLASTAITAARIGNASRVKITDALKTATQAARAATRITRKN